MLRGSMAARVYLILALNSLMYPALLGNNYDGCVAYRAIRNSLKYLYIIDNYVYFVTDGNSTSVYKSIELDDPSNITIVSNAVSMKTMWPALNTTEFDNFHYDHSFSINIETFKDIAFISGNKTNAITLDTKENSLKDQTFTQLDRLRKLHKWMFISFDNLMTFYSVEQAKDNPELYFKDWAIATDSRPGVFDLHEWQRNYYPYFDTNSHKMVVYNESNASNYYNFEPLKSWVLRAGYNRNQLLYLIGKDYVLKINTKVLDQNNYGKVFPYQNLTLQSILWPPCQDENYTVITEVAFKIDLKTVILSCVIVFLLLVVICLIVTRPNQVKNVSHKTKTSQAVSSKDPNFWLQPSVFSDMGQEKPRIKSQRHSKPPSYSAKKRLTTPIKSTSSSPSNKSKNSQISSKISKLPDSSQVSTAYTVRSENLSNTKGQTKSNSNKSSTK